MRRVKRESFLLLSAILIGWFALASTAGAEPVSELNFDEGSGAIAYNSVSGSPNGTLYGPTYAAGKIGDYALDFDGSNDYVDPTAGGYPNNSAGMATGTFSFWINTESTARAAILYYDETTTSDYTCFSLKTHTDQNNSQDIGNYFLYVRAKDSSYLKAELTTPDASWYNGDWHLITVAWDTKASGSSTNTAKYYIDGVAKTTTVSSSISSSDTFSAWTVGSLGVQITASALYYDGLLDDVSVWGDALTDTEALALCNLGNDTLNYGASDAQKLFDIFEAQGSGTTSDGLTWQYVTGLSGELGYVYDHDTLVLGAGDGVQIIPEPCSMALLACGLIGLLAYAWRKRT